LSLSLDLMLGVDRIPLVQLAPPVVPTGTAVGNAPVAMADHIRGRELVTASTRRNSGARWHDAEMVEVHTRANATGGLNSHPFREVAAARFEQPPPRDSQRIAAGPLAVSRGVALDPTTVRPAMRHVSMLVRAAIRTRDSVASNHGEVPSWPVLVEPAAESAARAPAPRSRSLPSNSIDKLRGGSSHKALKEPTVILRLTGLSEASTRAVAEAGDSRRASKIRTPFALDGDLAPYDSLVDRRRLLAGGALFWACTGATQNGRPEDALVQVYANPAKAEWPDQFRLRRSSGALSLRGGKPRRPPVHPVLLRLRERGPHFELRLLRARGLSRWPDSARHDVLWLRHLYWDHA